MRNTAIGESLKKSTGNIIFPTLPFKRSFTKEEREKMFIHFKNHSWSDIDSKGMIILGGGEESCGLYYITEKDLNRL